MSNVSRHTMRNHSVRFKTELFEYSAVLPEDANAGNRFYGRDLAEFLAKGLSDSSLNMQFIDEDWGWLVFGKTKDNKFLEIAIYNLSEDGTPGQNGTKEWGLWLKALEKVKWLGVFSKNREVEVPASFSGRLRQLLESSGITPVEWQTP
jgi:hypothetical protein